MIVSILKEIQELEPRVAATPATIKELLKFGLIVKVESQAGKKSFIQTTRDKTLVQALTKQKITCFSMHLIPRTTLAQKMDALSSQANIAGYKAVLIAATRLGVYMPLLMTAAGTIRPAKVLILGAGVAGLQAIATAKRLGAQVEAVRVAMQKKHQMIINNGSKS